MTDDTTKSEASFSGQQLEASDENALEILTQAADQGVALIAAWVARGNAAAVAAAAEHASGPHRKAARRGLNVLKARGVAIPKLARGGHPKAAKAVEPEVVESWMAAPDSAGSVALVIASHTTASRYRVVFTFLHDALGIQRFENGTLTQSQLRQSLARLVPGGSYRPVRVPVEWARWRIAEARRRNAERRVPLPLGATTARDLLEPVPSAAPPHPLDEEGLVIADEDAGDLSKDSAALHRLPEFRGWLPPRTVVDDLLRRVGQRLPPGKEPEQEGVQQELMRQMVAATDRYFSPQVRETLVKLMKDSTFSVLQRDGEEKALELVATMRVIERAGLITDPPHEVPFLRAFFEKAIGVLLAQGKGQLHIPIPQRLALEGEDDAGGAPAFDETPHTEEAAEAAGGIALGDGVIPAEGGSGDAEGPLPSAEGTEPSQAEPSQAELSQAEPSQAELSQAELSQAEPRQSSEKEPSSAAPEEGAAAAEEDPLNRSGG